MYHHIKQLMYDVHVDEPDVRFGTMLLEQFGGANGELAAAMQSPFRAGVATISNAKIFCSTSARKKLVTWKSSAR